MMKFDLGIDVRMIQHTGIGTYVRQILPGVLSRAKNKNIQTVLFESPALPSTQSAPAHRAFHSPIYSLREQWEYPRRLAQCKLWHAPHYNIPIWKGNTKLVVTIHDIIHWIFRKSFLSKAQTLYAGAMLRRAVEHSDHILTVSNYTKSDLVQHFHADPKKITVTHEAVDSHFSENAPDEIKSALKERHALPPSYYLYVGSFKPHKNLLWLIRTFKELWDEKKITSPLVLAGRTDPKNGELNPYLETLKNNPCLRHLSDVRSSELPALYQMSRALVHPSLYEGFGLTLLEAMASSIPVIACRNSSIPEVTGDGALLIDSSDSKALKKALIEIENSDSIRETLIENGKNNLKRFDWDKTAEQTFSVYEKVLSE